MHLLLIDLLREIVYAPTVATQIIDYMHLVHRCVVAVVLQYPSSPIVLIGDTHTRYVTCYSTPRARAQIVEYRLTDQNDCAYLYFLLARLAPAVFCTKDLFIPRYILTTVCYCIIDRLFGIDIPRLIYDYLSKNTH